MQAWSDAVQITSVSQTENFKDVFQYRNVICENKDIPVITENIQWLFPLFNSDSVCSSVIPFDRPCG